ncbi:unnamed protein product [Closterium sp. NIES-53]
MSIDGQMFLVEVMAMVLVDGPDTFHITTWKQYLNSSSLTRELRLAARAKRAAERSRVQFLANMSHELRTPINGVLGYAQLMMQTQLDPEQQSYLQSIYESGEVLLGTVSQVLEMSQLQKREVVPRRVRFNLHRAIGEAAGSMRPLAHRKGLQFGISMDRAVPHAVLGDPSMLRQLLLHLLSNALKFTHQGTVQLTVRVLAPPGAGAGAAGTAGSGGGLGAGGKQRGVSRRVSQVMGKAGEGLQGGLVGREQHEQERQQEQQQQAEQVEQVEQEEGEACSAANAQEAQLLPQAAERERKERERQAMEREEREREERERAEREGKAGEGEEREKDGPGTEFRASKQITRLSFEVVDTGVGVPPDMLHQIFKPFVQVDNSAAREYQGLGLGLAIAQSLVRLLGGEGIHIESEPDKGSCFAFTLPFEVWKGERKGGREKRRGREGESVGGDGDGGGKVDGGEKGERARIVEERLDAVRMGGERFQSFEADTEEFGGLLAEGSERERGASREGEEGEDARKGGAGSVKRKRAEEVGDDDEMGMRQERQGEGKGRGMWGEVQVGRWGEEQGGEWGEEGSDEMEESGKERGKERRRERGEGRGESRDVEARREEARRRKWRVQHDRGFFSGARRATKGQEGLLAESNPLGAALIRTTSPISAALLRSEIPTAASLGASIGAPMGGSMGASPGATVGDFASQPLLFDPEMQAQAHGTAPMRAPHAPGGSLGGSQGAGAGKAGTAGAGKTGTGLKCLVVDDNAVNRSVLQRLLRSLGAEQLVLARNGAEAVAVCEKDGEGLDVVFMDLHMPVMDGFEASARILGLWRSRYGSDAVPRTSSTSQQQQQQQQQQQVQAVQPLQPQQVQLQQQECSFRYRPLLVAITASALEEEEEKCRKVGMDFFLTKPVRLASLQSLLDHLGSSEALTCYHGGLRHAIPHFLSRWREGRGQGGCWNSFLFDFQAHNPSRERDCHFLVSLKKSKKERRAAKKKVSEPEYIEADGSVAASSTPSSPKSVDDVSLFKDKPDSSSSDDEASDSRSGEHQKQLPPFDKSSSKNELRHAAVEPSQPPVSVWKTGSALKILKGQKASKPAAVQEEAVNSGSFAAGDMGARGVSVQGKPHPSVTAPNSHAGSPGLPVTILNNPLDSNMRSSSDGQRTMDGLADSRAGHPVARVVPTADKFTASTLASAAAAAPAVVQAHSFQPSHVIPAGGFTLFGPDLSSIALGDMFHNAMAVDLRFGMRKLCHFCSFCQERRIVAVPFHWCVDDQVVSGSKGPSPAGPIGRRHNKHRVGVMA